MWKFTLLILKICSKKACYISFKKYQHFITIIFEVNNVELIDKLFSC